MQIPCQKKKKDNQRFYRDYDSVTFSSEETSKEKDSEEEYFVKEDSDE